MSNINLKRRHFLSAGGLAAAGALGVGAVGLGASPAHALPVEATPVAQVGRRHHYRLTSPAVSRAVNVNILLPEGYDPARRYPVLYLLHGGGGDFNSFFPREGYPDDIDIAALTAGKELIVVMPDGGQAGWYSNPASQSLLRKRNWETFHMDHLIPWIDANFSTHAEYDGRAVSGFSMGGFGALKYAAKYYGHFASVSSHSGPASLRIDNGIVAHWANFSSLAESGRLLYGAPWREHLVSADNAVENVERYRHKRIFLVCGNDTSAAFDGRINFPGIDQLHAQWGAFQEQHVRNGHRQFSELLTQAGIPHERYEDHGGHYIRKDRLEADLIGIVGRLKRAS